MTSYFELTKMSEEQLNKELEKAKRRVSKAKEDVSIIRSFIKLKSLEAESQKPKSENRETGKPETAKPEKPDNGYLDLGAAKYIDI